MTKTRGFTLIELLVVLAIVALLSTLALPRYFQSVDGAKDTVLRENLQTTRITIDKFYADTGRYPDSLEELVEKKYLRSVPLDPVSGSSATWRITAPVNAEGQVFDLHSGAAGNGRDGVPYADY